MVPPALIEIREPSDEQLSQLALIHSAAQFLNQRFIILLSCGQLASFLIWRKVDEDEFEILQLETVPRFWRQGFARRLLETFLQQNKGKVFLEVRESNTAARQLYEGKGFKIIGRRRGYYSGPREDAIVLRLSSC